MTSPLCPLIFLKERGLIQKGSTRGLCRLRMLLLVRLAIGGECGQVDSLDW